jgi:hypothetical protein
MQRGTLRLFALIVPVPNSPHGPDLHAFAALGGPQTFSLGGQLTFDDVEFGDGECKEVPEWLDLSGGLWVLEWAWEQYVDEDEPQFFDCRYDDHGTWRRLTDVELQALANGTLDSLTSEVTP